jgi:hypothetical protein
MNKSENRDQKINAVVMICLASLTSANVREGWSRFLNWDTYEVESTNLDGRILASREDL